MVSCRNLLIYFSAEVQKQVIPTFHYALRPDGYLFLGTSEGISQHTDLFVVVDKKHRIFQAREHAARVPRLTSGVVTSGANERPFLERSAKTGNPLRRIVEAHVLERFAPAHVVVNGEGEIVYFSAGTGRFLELPQGPPSRQLLTMARRGLRLDLRAALSQAIETRQSVVFENIALDEGDDLVQPVNVRVEPLPDAGQGEALYLVLFALQGSPQSRSDASRQKMQQEENVVAALERDLRETRERLQAMVEEYETSLEELKSANEELVSVNEEAQSSNEELEASKEEMHSLNEELNTINAELAGKVEALDKANSDLRNLFESTQIATVFLDRQLVIRNFTPAATAFFNLLPADMGRPLTDLASYLDYPELKEHIRGVFESGEICEHRIARKEQARHYLVRLIPYRDADDNIEGVVVTFLDVTSLAEAESHQKVLIEELNHRVKNMLAVVISVTQQTMRRSPSKEALGEALIGRLQAMARAYGTLSREDWKPVPTEMLIRQELEAFDSSAVTFDGPHVEVPPQIGLPVGMVVHELGTNAAKYGALSRPGGRVTVTWDFQPEERMFRMRWRESDGPPVKAPDGEGFGLKLIRGEIEYRLGGRVQADFRPDGLQLELEFPI
jgi:two-component system CheB/CheR fusion protein